MGGYRADGILGDEGDYPVDALVQGFCSGLAILDCYVMLPMLTSVDQQVRDAVEGVSHADEEDLGRFVGSVLLASLF